MRGAVPSATATRVDPRTGAREEVAFFGEEELLFGCLHLPAAAPSAGVLICSPLASEFEKNYRRETLLAWALARRGVAVGRFHYRGVGHSDGDARDVSIDRMIEDARAAAGHLLERTGVDRISLVGTRLASLVVAAVARDHPGAPLALWEPILAGDQYFREVFRAGFMGDVKRGATDEPPSHAAMRERMARDGWVDVLGYTVGQALYRSAADRTLDRELEGSSRPILLVQLGQSQKVSRPYHDAVARWRERGSEVEIRIVDEAEAWWFGEERRGKEALIQATADWLAARIADEVAS